MDAQTLLDRMQDLSLLNQDKSFEWEALAEKYPYFNVAQWLRYSHDALHDKENLEYVALYKNDPLKFAKLFNRLQIEKTKKADSKEATKLSLDEHSNETIAVTVKEDVNEIVDQSEMVLDEQFIPIVELMVEEKVSEVQLDEEEEIISSIDTKEIESLIEQLPLEEADHKTAHVETTFEEKEEVEEDKSLMVMMSFTDWLNHFKNKTAREKEELHSKKALKTAWQKEKLSAAIEEEGDEIPEGIFKQAMESISDESIMISESLAGILAKQGKKDKAIDMYKKLSLRNPEKSTYFASLINDLNLSNN